MDADHKIEEIIGKPAKVQGRDLFLESLRTQLTESPAQRHQRESEEMDRGGWEGWVEAQHICNIGNWASLHYAQLCVIPAFLCKKQKEPRFSSRRKR
jgi:hypothetical protein